MWSLRNQVLDCKALKAGAPVSAGGNCQGGSGPVQEVSAEDSVVECANKLSKSSITGGIAHGPECGIGEIVLPWGNGWQLRGRQGNLKC